MLLKIGSAGGVTLKKENNKAIRREAAKGNAKGVYTILLDPQGNPGDVDNEALIMAIKYGHVMVVRLLLEYEAVDPKARENLPIVSAAITGNTKIIKILIRCGVDPSTRNNEALSRAVDGGKLKAVQFLMKDDRVSQTVSGELKTKISNLVNLRKFIKK
jgi:hypothetical protein